MIIPIDIKREDLPSPRTCSEHLFSSPWWAEDQIAGHGVSCDGSPNGLGGWTPTINNDQEQKDTDNDSVLLLRQMVITDLAKQPVQGGTYPFLEHPEDPKLRSKSPSAGKCSTIWILPEYRHLATRQAHSRISCDQCVLGQIVTKRTTLSTNLDLNHWHDIRCKHPAHALPEGTT